MSPPVRARPDSAHGAPMSEAEIAFAGYLSGRFYFTKRSGWRWQVWFRYQDGAADRSSGADQWIVSPQKYLSRLRAERVALSCQEAFNSGVWCESGRANLLEGQCNDD